MQRIKFLGRAIQIKGKKVTLKINMIGLLCSVFLTGVLAIYIYQNRDYVNNVKETLYELEDGQVEQGEEISEVSWTFQAEYRYLKHIMVGINNAPEYAGRKIIISIENNYGMNQIQEYVIQGQDFSENYIMVLSEIIGKGNSCIFTVSGDNEILGNIVYGYTYYIYYNMFLLTVLLWSCFLIFVNLCISIEGEKRWYKWMIKGFKIMSLFTIPIMLIYVMEYLSGSINGLKNHVLIANIVICTFLYLIVFIITNRLRFSLLFTSGIVFVLSLIEYFVLLFRGSPLLPYDITSFQTAISVVGEYQFELNEKLIFSAFIFIAVISAAYRMPFKIKGAKKRIGFITMGTGMTVGMLCFFYGVIYQAWGLSYSTWAPVDTYMENGYFMSTMIFTKYANIKKPEGYSAEKAREILENFQPKDETPNDIVPENLIVVMNESWSSLDYIEPIKTNIPYNEFYQSMGDNTIKGNLYVSICGGNTPQTEYEFFTGNSVSLLPTGATAYEFFVNKNTESICNMLVQEEYTCFAIHPFGGNGYNRHKVYQHFGFDEFITEEAFEGYDKIRSFYSDKATYDKVIELFENKKQGEKLFIWNLTMQNHGGYISDASFEKKVILTDYPEYEQAATYLTLMKYSDEALKELISYFENVEEPTMIVMFGDHQPNLSDGIYDILLGREEFQIEGEELEKRYITPFLIWNNYGVQEDYINQMSANYLSSYILKQAGLPSTAYRNLLLDLYQSYPVINTQGVYDSKGKYWSWNDIKESPDYEKIRNYRIVEYFRIKEKNKENTLFAL